MSLHDTFVQKIIDHYFMFFAAQLTGDTTVYLGLSTADPLDDGSGIAEPATADGYARVNIGATSSVGWSIANGVASNTTAIEFPEAAASWGTITHWFISTSPTRGVAPDRMFNSIGTAIAIPANKALVLPVGFFDLGTVDTGTFSDLHSTELVDAEILNHMLTDTAAIHRATYLGLHTYPFIPEPVHDGTFGEVWDVSAGSGYNRTFVNPGDLSFGGFDIWENPKDGEVQNTNGTSIPFGANVSVGFATKHILILDAQGSDPGGGSPAGTGGGNLMFWSERASNITLASGDRASVAAGALDITLD